MLRLSEKFRQIRRPHLAGGNRSVLGVVRSDLVQRASAVVGHHAGGGLSLAWHFSLQHEAIHAFRGVPAWLRFAVVFPPLGLWFPYPFYRKSHTTHHRDINLTIPGVDTESYYVLPADWERMGPIQRALADLQPNDGGPLAHRTGAALVESRHQGNPPRAPGRSYPPAALGRARRRLVGPVLVHFRRLRLCRGGSTVCSSPTRA